MAESKSKKRSTSTKKRTTTAKSSRPARSTKTTRTKKSKSPVVEVDRRRTDRRNIDAADNSADEPDESKPKLERRAKVNRRRQIDPTTCERDYSNDEIEFMRALDDYKRTSGRQFPTCSEILEVVRALGYVKRPTTTAFVVSEPSDTESDAEQTADQPLAIS